MRERFAWSGLEQLANRLRRVAGSVAYVTVTDRTDRKDEEQLGRFDFKPENAIAFARDAEPESSFEDEGGDEADEETEETVEVTSSSPAADRIVEAAIRWLRDVAIRNTVGEPYRRFRVKAYGPKAGSVVDSGTFVCKNLDHDLDLPADTQIAVVEAVPDLKIPTPNFDEAANAGVLRGIKSLGDYYAQWGHIVLGSMSQLQGVNNAMIGRLHRQVEESRSQVDELVAALIDYRTAQVTVVEERKAESQASDARTQLAKEALTQIGQAAQAFLVGRGIPPELADVLGSISNSPDLMAAMNDPEVRELMKDPNNLSALAGMLRNATAAAKAARAGTETPS